MRSILLIVSMGILSSSLLFAAGPVTNKDQVLPGKAVTVQCEVEKVLDEGEFEGEYDFTFEEYPYLIYSNDGNGRLSLLLGAMEYSTDKDNNLNSPYNFSVTVNSAGMTFVEATTEENDDRVIFAYDSEGLLASFKGKPVAFCSLKSIIAVQR